MTPSPHPTLAKVDVAIQTGSKMWDPGKATDDGSNQRETNSCKITNELQSLISSAMIGEVSGDGDYDSRGDGSRTELDSHANMPVVGKHAFIISDTGRIAEVKAYTPDYDAMQVPIVDAAVKYECPYSGSTYILVIRNALHVPSMTTNLIPPFMLREAGIVVNDTPKIQVDDPTADDHSIYFPETQFRIPMSLWGIFSYFPTSKPSEQDMVESEEVYMMTPTKWNPHQSTYAENEENMLDWEGNMVERRYRQKVFLSNVEDDKAMAASVQIGSVEVRAVEKILTEPV